MSLPLTADDLARFEAASRALLCVLHADVDAWRADVTRTLRDFLRADDVLFALPGEIDCFASDELTSEALNAYRPFFEAPLPRRPLAADSAAGVYFIPRQPWHVPALARAASQDDLEVSLKKTGFYDAIRRLSNQYDVLALYAPVRRSEVQIEALLAALYPPARSSPRGETGSGSSLRALLPSFQAGLEIYLRLHAPPPAASPGLPAPETLRTQYGLTRREAEVAVLLAQGLSNDALAARLFISPHTARHHTESVLAKLALSSRKALAFKLLQDARHAA